MLLAKLLWSKQKKRQLWLAMLGTVIGFFLLFVALQTYFDIQHIVKGKESNFVVVNKKVSLFSLIGGVATFSKADLAEFKSQPFISQVAAFSASQFQVLAEVSQIGFRSEFFFEAVPDAFLDVETSDFRWSEGDKTLPIILSRDYLSLYNFGFAPTRGLPPFTQSTIKQVRFQIRIINKNGNAAFYTGKVVGFSDRINSILVPKSFLDWANLEYDNSISPSSKLILEVNNPYGKDFKTFLADNKLELSSGKLIGDKLGSLLNTTVSIISGIGLLILVLALMVFILNFRLLIAAAQSEIKLLFDLGYTSKTISKTLLKRMTGILWLSIGLSVAGMIAVRYWLVDWLNGQGVELSLGFHPLVYVLIIGVVALVFVVNIFSVRRYVEQLGVGKSF